MAVATTQAGTAGTQYVFSAWNDSGAASHSITVGGSPATYTASFQTQYQLTDSASPSAGGTVSPASGGFYNAGTVVPITATANTGYTFSGWTGPVANPSNASTTVTMSAAETIGATFSAVPVPTIGNLNPTSGPVGTAVTITGTNFGATQSSSTVTFTGTSAGTATSWSATSITVNVPSGATSGNVVVTVGGVASNGAAFTVLGPPSITGISPGSGPVGTPVTVTGTNFGATQGSSSVWFGTASAGTAVSWSNTSIAVNVPIGASHGGVSVYVGNVSSNIVSFTVTVPPTITGLSPAAGPIGTTVTITGTNFGTTQGASTVAFNGTPAGTVVNWSATSITVAVPSGATTGNVVVTVTNLASNGFPFTVPPTVNSVSPSPATPGSQVSISGNSFGSSQGAGSVWLGTTPGAVVSWSATQIVATVASNAISGTAQVQQGGIWSNAVTLMVNTTTVSNVVPTSGVPGTQVTFSGSGFGAAQGNGQVWLGTAYGVVVGWSDTQVVAQVAAGSASGNAQILQNGVWSTPVSFTVNTLQINNVSPSSGLPGASVTIAGSGFGSSQGGGIVWLGSTQGQVVSWSDTQVVAAVAAGAVSGVARVQQNGVWSNAVGFTVPGGNTVVPAMLNMEVGDTHTIQAVTGTGQAVSGLAWASSNPSTVSLSADNPPILTAVATGRATITAGGGSADVTVWPAGTLSQTPGTVLWSNPGNGSGVTKIVPAVPSASGVADVFAFQADGTVQAITSDGVTAWSADVSAAQQKLGSGYSWVPFHGSVLPDFLGGLIVSGCTANGGVFSVVKLDGMSGQPDWTYTVPGSVAACTGTTYPPVRRVAVVPGTDTVFVAAEGAATVVGLDPATGAQKFSVPMQTGVANNALYDAIVAGDGYAYVAYGYADGSRTIHLMLLRVNGAGASNQMDVDDFPDIYPGGENTTINQIAVNMITNADQGVLISWVVDQLYEEAGTYQYDAVPRVRQRPLWAPMDVTVDVDGFVSVGMAVSNGTSVTAVNPPTIPGQASHVVPMVQLQDGSFVGVIGLNSQGGYYIGPALQAACVGYPGVTCPEGVQRDMIAFDASGNVRWVVPNDQPAIATDDGGVIGQSGIKYDQGGNATGQIDNLPEYSWTQRWYSSSLMQVTAVAYPVVEWATCYQATAGGNPSFNGAAVGVAAPVEGLPVFALPLRGAPAARPEAPVLCCSRAPRFKSMRVRNSSCLRAAI